MLAIKKTLHRPFKAVHVSDLNEAAKLMCSNLPRCTAIIYGQTIFLPEAIRRKREDGRKYAAFYSSQPLHPSNGTVDVWGLSHMTSFWIEPRDYFIARSHLERYGQPKGYEINPSTAGHLVLEYGEHRCRHCT